MVTLNTAIWGNGSGAQVQNDSSQLTHYVAREYALDPQYIFTGLAALGLPGNLFVIAVYVRNITSSTKVYMFALAVSDTAACVAWIIFHSDQYAKTTTFFSEPLRLLWNKLFCASIGVCGDRASYGRLSSTSV